MGRTIAAALLLLTAAWSLRADIKPTEDVYEAIQRHRSIISEIEQKEKVLNSLKAGSTGRDLWNFVDRHRRERAIQERGKVSLELNKLNIAAVEIEKSLTRSFNDFSAGIKSNAQDRRYVTAYIYMAALQAKSAKTYEVLTESGIKAALKAGKIDFLQERLNSQETVLAEMKNALKRLTEARAVIGEANLSEELDSAVSIVSEKIKEIESSNNLISR